MSRARGNAIPLVGNGFLPRQACVLGSVLVSACVLHKQPQEGRGGGARPETGIGACRDTHGTSRPDGSTWQGSYTVRFSGEAACADSQDLSCSCVSSVIQCLDRQARAAAFCTESTGAGKGGEGKNNGGQAGSQFDSERLCGPGGQASERLQHREICKALGESYSKGPLTVGQTTYRPPHAHGDINIFVRGFDCISGGGMAGSGLSLLAWDSKAPRIQTMFKPVRDVQFANLYATNAWDWSLSQGNGARSGGLTGQMEVGDIRAAKGERIHVPSSGYDIGSGFEVMVLYASPSTLTLKYTRDDNIVGGYGLHFTGICVDPQLVSLFEATKSSGERPTLRARQAFGYALGNEVQVSVRDTGSFMNVTSRHDWFQEDIFDR